MKQENKLDQNAIYPITDQAELDRREYLYAQCRNRNKQLEERLRKDAQEKKKKETRRQWWLKHGIDLYDSKISFKDLKIIALTAAISLIGWLIGTVFFNNPS